MKAEWETIDHAAAKWLAAQEQGLSADQETALARWLAADARHAASYGELKKAWSRLDRVRGAGVSAQLEAELEDLPVRSGGGGPFRSLRPHVGPWLAGAFATGCVVLIAYFAWLRPMQTSVPYFASIATEIGGVRSLTLPDRSVVWINSDSALEVFFTPQERRARLVRGEAFFTVAKDPARPFVVGAAGVDVRAVGTEFNVRLQETAIEVTVREGKVSVADAQNGLSLLPRPATGNIATAPLLVAGQRIVVPVTANPMLPEPSVAPTAITAQEIERSLAWQSQRLVFESAPLSTIVREFNRHNSRSLIIEDAALAARRFGGTFEANDPKTFLEMLGASGEIVAEERARDTLLRWRR